MRHRLAIFWCSTVVISACSAIVIKVLHLYDESEGLPESQATLETAVERARLLKKASRGLQNVNFSFDLQETQCDPYTGLAIASRVYFRESSRYHAIIGPYCTKSLEPLANFAVGLDFPIISYTGVNPTLYDKSTYQTLIRVCPTMMPMAHAVANLLTYFSWSRIGIVSKHGYCDQLMSALDNVGANYTVEFNVEIDSDANINSSETYRDAIKQIAENPVPAVLLCLGSKASSARAFMIEADLANFTDGDTAFIIAEPQTILSSNDSNDDGDLEPWTNTNEDESRNNIARQAFKAALILTAEGAEDAGMVEKFNRIIKKTPAVEDSLKRLNRTFKDNRQRMLLYDAMLVYASALNICLNQNVSSYTSGREIFNCSMHVNIETAYDHIYMDSNADREFTYLASSFDEAGNHTAMLRVYTADCDVDDIDIDNVTISNYTVGHREIEMSAINQTENYDDICVKRVKVLRPLWFVSSSRIPQYSRRPSMPPPPFPVTKYALSAALGVVACLAIASVVGFLMYRKHMRRRFLQADWQVSYKDILYPFNRAAAMKQGSQYLRDGTSQSLPSLGGSKEQELDMESGKTELGLYKGTVVFINSGPRAKEIVFSNKEISLIKTMMSLQHENVNRMIGVCVDKPGWFWTLWGYNSRESLKQTLNNTELDLDFVFQSSIVRDIVKGLEYLHKSPLQFHGALTTFMVVVSSRWIVKLTGFGVSQLYIPMMQQGTLTYREDTIAEYMNYAAPELKVGDSISPGSKAADMFGLANIIYEIIYRAAVGPKEEKTHDDAIADINKSLLSSGRGRLPTSGGWHSDVLQMLKQCWSIDPLARPTIGQVKKTIEAHTFRGKNLVDHMFSVMEKYAANLEELVHERTQQLDEEKKRADKLLYEMLPKCIAEELKAGRQVLPESFESATVYFSDVVGFTVICSDSTPIEVVNMLNALYQQFDEIIQLHDCFKVETIGDAYLVVSGIPKRNSGKHVEEIANMSLHIRELVKTRFTVPHLPEGNNKLAVRIGVHSGPVAAGVVGLSMPRYCVFGDTVNVASRMESHGEALKIHISWATFELLKEKPQYVISERGLNQIKGKGMCHTYWLESKTVGVTKTKAEHIRFG